MPRPSKNFSKLLNTVSTNQSNYEFTHFFLEKYPTPARQLVAVIEQVENLKKQLPINSDKKITIQREIDMLTTWLNSVDNKQEILDNYENEESEYWAHVLGREAAIEIISIGKTSKETMTKMSLLPVEDFEESVRVCVRFATLIRETTNRVEKELEDGEVNILKT